MHELNNLISLQTSNINLASQYRDNDKFNQIEVPTFKNIYFQTLGIIMLLTHFTSYSLCIVCETNC